MKYERIEKAVFLERENRFVAYVELEGKRETVHVKNTGRCEELLIPGAEVYLQKSENEKRATLWDLIAVKKGERLVNLDSQIPNRCVEEWLQTGNLFKEIQCIRPEITYGDSRLDLYAEGDGKKAFIEVKGVTLEEDGVCLFPDAPSERAVRHIEELIKEVNDNKAQQAAGISSSYSDISLETLFLDSNTSLSTGFKKALEEAPEEEVIYFDDEAQYHQIIFMKKTFSEDWTGIELYKEELTELIAEETFYDHVVQWSDEIEIENEEEQISAEEVKEMFSGK